MQHLLGALLHCETTLFHCNTSTLIISESQFLELLQQAILVVVCNTVNPFEFIIHLCLAHLFHSYYRVKIIHAVRSYEADYGLHFYMYFDFFDKLTGTAYFTTTKERLST